MQLRGRCRSNSQLSRNTQDAVGWRGDEGEGAREGGGRGRDGDGVWRGDALLIGNRGPLLEDDRRRVHAIL